MQIQIEQIIPNPEQPRTVFDEAEIETLADSLRQHGLLNPIAVEGPYDGYFILVDGERRTRAARVLGWDTIEAHVVDGHAGNGTGQLVMALVGNLQRADMGPVDEARAYARLRESMSVREICDQVGRSDAHVYGRLGMLEWGLADEVLKLINVRRLPSDVKMLRVLCQLPDEIQVPLAQRAARSGCSASRIKGLVTRALHKRPLHCVQRPDRNVQAKPALAPALAACSVNVEDLSDGIGEMIVAVCNRCGMGSDQYNNIICRDCPLTDFLRLFIKNGV